MSQHRLTDFARAAYSATAGHLEVDPEPDEPRPHRWVVSTRAAAAGVAAVAVVAAGVGLRAWAESSAPEPLPPAVAGGGAPDADAVQGIEAATGAGAERGDARTGEPAGGPAPGAVAGDAARDGAGEAAGPLVVHVAGQVATPGIVELPAGARVADAVAAAGGALPEAELGAVNLARLVADGEQVYVPAPGEVTPAAPAPGAGAAAGGGPGVVNLNTAGLDELDTLPGVGPAIAQRILDRRETHGPFTSVDELDAVSGIGPVTLEKLRDLVTV